jgi:hypothetical protein
MAKATMIARAAKVLKRLRRKPKAGLPERARMVLAIDRAEITDPLYESKQKALYGPDWRPAA